MIYLDNASTTPMTMQTAMAIMEAQINFFGNPDSPHEIGQKVSDEVFKARKQICKRLFGNENANQIVFTSCGTEANNLAILGLKDYLIGAKRTHIVTSATEHKSVLLAVKALEREGFTATYISPGRKGYITAEQVVEAMREDTGLVSIMYVNNETGCINEIKAIQEAVHSRGNVLLHSDCVQAAGFLDLSEIQADMISVSAHKIHGPKGIGCLYFKDTETMSLMKNILYGGEQELFIRPGTLNTAGIIGFAYAVNCLPVVPADWQEIYMANALEKKVEGFHRNFHEYPCSPRIGSYRFDGVDGDTLVSALSLRGLYVSTGAACNSQSVEPSYVLIESGLTPQEASETIRVSFANGTTIGEIDEAVNIISEAVSFLRNRDAEGDQDEKAELT